MILRPSLLALFLAPPLLEDMVCGFPSRPSVEEPRALHRVPHLLFRRRTRCHQRQAYFVLAQAEQACRIFDGSRIGIEEKRVMERQQPVLNFKCLAEVTSKRCLLELCTERRGDIRRDRDAANAAMRIEAERRRILTGKLTELRPHSIT